MLLSYKSFVTIHLSLPTLSVIGVEKKGFNANLQKSGGIKIGSGHQDHDVASRGSRRGLPFSKKLRITARK